GSAVPLPFCIESRATTPHRISRRPDGRKSRVLPDPVSPPCFQSDEQAELSDTCPAACGRPYSENREIRCNLRAPRTSPPGRPSGAEGKATHSRIPRVGRQAEVCG